MKLLIDIGNSCLKWTLADQQHLAPVQSIAYRQSSVRELLLADWCGLQRPECVLLASVATSECLLAVQQLISELWPDCVVHRAEVQASLAGVRVAYQEPAKLGVDRWLVLLASQHFYTGNSCIVDCGTATTVDFLTKSGQHLGGLIAPGLAMMQESLQSGTARLPQVNHGKLNVTADTTESAIFSGCVWSTVGLIDSVMRKQQSQQLILTGGAAAAILDALERPAILDQALVLRGLLVYASYHL